MTTCRHNSGLGRASPWERRRSHRQGQGRACVVARRLRVSQRDGKLKVAVAVLALLAAVAGGIIAFATRKVGIQVAGVVLALVVIAAALKALSDVRDALTPKCGG